MKLLYISESIIPSRSANSIHVMKMCQAFCDIGHEVVLLAPKKNEKSEFSDIDCFNFYGVEKKFKIVKLWHPNFKFGFIFYAFSIFFHVILSKKYDLVYGRFLLGCFAATLLGNKVVFESHQPLLEKRGFGVAIFNILIKNKNFKKLVVISEALKSLYLKNNSFIEKHIYVAHDGADMVTELNKKVVLSGNTSNLQVGYVGHLYKGRGIDLILNCAKELNSVDFNLVGGNNEDIDYWREKIEKMGIKNIYFYGFVHPKETIFFRNSFDILLAPYSQKVSISGDTSADSSGYMSPLKIFEYMASKKPIICSNLPVLREILNESNSILVSPEDYTEWVSAIKKLEDFNFRKIISEKAYLDFAKYTWRNRARLILES
jgi:glycosyltransferase involved in cell wall biosynthesis